MSQLKLPVDKPEFWRKRILARLEAENPTKSAELYRAVYDMALSNWKEAQEAHREILSKLIQPYVAPNVLDAGCAYGALLEILPTSADYIGVDISPDFIRLAKQRYPYRQFVVSDLRRLPFKDQEFDLAIARSVEGMVMENLGAEAWRQMESELLRVANRLVLLNFSEPTQYRVIDAFRDPAERSYKTLEEDGGRLVYRPGQDGTCEIYDLAVEEPQRRRGVATKLVQRVVDETFGTVYGFCRASNYDAHAFYTSLGFRLTQIPGFYRGEDGVLFIKPFNQDNGANQQ